MKNINEIISEYNYKVDYLSDGSPIFQSNELYTFTSDSTALSKFVKNDKIPVMADLCAGSGIVGLEVMAQKEVGKLYLVELQEALSNMAKCSAFLSPRAKDIEVINMDAKDVPKIIGRERVNVITINPPYFKAGSGAKSKNVSRQKARMEESATLEDFIFVAYELLISGGELYMVHIEDRLKEINRLLTKIGFLILEEETLPGKLKRVLIHAKKI